MNPLRRGTDTAELVRKAARNAETRREENRVGACIEINSLDPNRTSYSHHNPLCKRFRKLFNETDSGMEAPTIWGWDDESQDERVLALCFFAAMVEAGDAP